MVALGLAHALVVAPRYHVGSFDDDASYVLAARALASGHGITSRLAGGYPLVGVYPPGYPALLGPLALIWRSGVLPFRILSLALFLGVFPLTWTYLGRRRVSEPGRLAILALLALNPVLATYATMVMPEMAFVVVLLLMLLAVDQWEGQPRTVTGAGVGTVVAAAGLLWLKEAGVGLVIGLVAWLVFRRLFRKALLSAVAPAALFLPLLLIRAGAGADLIGSRYSGDLGAVFHGGLMARVGHLAPVSARMYATQALPRAIVPTSSGLLPSDGPMGALWALLVWTAAPLVILGFVVWCRRHPDAACLVVPVYLAETLVYPFINERRVVLVMPAIVAWYVLGATEVFTAVRAGAGRVGGPASRALGVATPVAASLLVVASLLSQFTRDYLYFEGADSSSPGGSPYMAMLGQLGHANDVVETDYLWTTTLYTGHRSANGAIRAGCDRPAVAAAVRADGAGYFLTGSLNGGGDVDVACLLPIVAGLPGSVRLYRSRRDQASVFELVGPGTAHPGIRDLLEDAVVDGGPHPVTSVDEAPQTAGDPAGRYLTVPATNGAAALTWSWRQPVSISQISLGAVGADTTPTSVQVSVRGTDGTWHVVAAAPGAVGAGTGHPFLLLRHSHADVVTAVRVTVAAPGSPTVAVHDFHALGPGP